MTQITAEISIAAPVADVYAKVATSKGLSQWFAEAYFKVNQQFGSVRLRVWDEVDLVVTETASPASIAWHCTSADHPWFNTSISFTFRSEAELTVVSFEQGGWSSVTPAFEEWGERWPALLEALKQLLESGPGALPQK